MKLTILASPALLLGAGLMLSASTQAHNAGHKLDRAQCDAAWTKASPNGEAIPENQAEPYVINFIIVDSDADGKITVEEFKEACADGLMTDEATTKDTEGGK